VNTRRFRYSIIMLLFIVSLCVSVKFTETSVRKSFADAFPVVSLQETNNPSEIEPIIRYRTEREQLRQMQKSQLNDIIFGENSDDEIVRSAQEQLLNMLETERTEVLLESILHLRGFEEAVVMINGESINVLIGTEDHDENKIAIIYDLIMTETGISGGNTKIIPIN